MPRPARVPRSTSGRIETQTLTLIVHAERAGEATKYVGQCVELDICVQGRNFDELKGRFEKSLRGHVVIAQTCGLVPFESIAREQPLPAPQPAPAFRQHVPFNAVNERLNGSGKTKKATAIPSGWEMQLA